MKVKKINQVILSIGLVALFVIASVTPLAAGEHTIKVVDRHLFGPGPFPDQKLNTAWIRHLKLRNFLNGSVNGFNNLEREPNVSGEVRQGRTVDGRLSDNTLINENIDMGNAVIMNDQFNLLLAAVYGGPNRGDTHFYVDEDFNWWIKDDIAIDPGFEFGVVKINDFTFTTKPRIIPYSLQTQQRHPGGMDQVGSTAAGRVASGSLGDRDQNGLLDGTFNAIGIFPLTSMFLPGAPFVQTFGFESDIPISAADAALLTVANAKSLFTLAQTLQRESAGHPDIELMVTQVYDRLRRALSHIDRALDGGTGCPPHCAKLNLVKSAIESVLVVKGKNEDVVRLGADVERAFRELKAVHKGDRT